jgi:hypothetical protein
MKKKEPLKEVVFAERHSKKQWNLKIHQFNYKYSGTFKKQEDYMFVLILPNHCCTVHYWYRYLPTPQSGLHGLKTRKYS